jgi:hypothetical protein
MLQRDGNDAFEQAGRGIDFRPRVKARASCWRA